MQSFPRLALRASTLALAVALAACSGGESSGLTRVKTAIATRDSRTATIEAKSFIQKYPKSAEGRFLLAQVLVQSNEHAGAVPEFQRALDNGHPPQLVLPLMANTMIKAGESARVVAMFKDQHLDSPEAAASLGAAVALAMAMQGDLAGSTDLTERLLATQPASAPLRVMKARLEMAAGRGSAGLAMLDSLIAEQPRDADAWITRGDYMLHVPNGQQAAADAFAKALEIRPDDTFALGAMVSVQLRLGQPEAAKTRLARLKKVAPKQFDTKRVEALVAYADRDHAAARGIYQLMLRAAPDHVPTLLMAGENELQLGAQAQAEALFAKASSLAPDNPVARRLLAQAQVALSQPAKALVTLAPLVDQPDAAPEVLYLAAHARMLNGEARVAGELLDRLAKLKPANPQMRTAAVAAGFGKQSDEAVFNQLRQISDSDRGISADMAIINAHQQKGQFDAAMQATVALERKRPKDAMVPHLRGQLQLLNKDPAAARKSFEQALALNPRYLPAVAGLAKLDLDDKQPEHARKRFTDLLKLQPSNGTALLSLADISLRQGSPRDTVLKELRQAVKAAPRDTSTHKALVNFLFDGGEVEQALNAAQVATAAFPDDLETLDLLARCQVKAGQTHQALTTYGKMVNLNQRSPHPHLGIIDAQLAAGDLDAAARAADRLQDLAPDLPAGLGRQAVIALRRQDLSAAQAVARKLQAQPATVLEGLVLEGQIAIQRQAWDAAIPPLRKAVDQFGSSPAAILLQTVLLKSGKTAAAQALVTDWLRLHPKDTAFLFNLGALAEQAGQPAEAEKRYREVLAVDANQPMALNNLAMLLVGQKRDGAVELAMRAVERAQDKATVLDTLAQAYAADGQVSKAVQAQAQAVALAPAEHDWRLRLARLQVEAGNKAAAKTELDKLVALGPAFSQQAEAVRLRESLRLLPR